PPLEPVVLEEVAGEDWTRLKVSFATLPSPAAHASRIRAWLFIPKGRDGPRPAIIALHQTVPQGKDEPAGGRGARARVGFAASHAKRGYVTLAPEMIGFGERTAGGYARTGFEWEDARPILDRHPDMTLLGLMLFDVSRCVDYLAGHAAVDAGRIGVMGH